MNSFIVDTNDFLYDDDNVYCDGCKSCGELGCGCWGNCIALRCKYGDTLINQYEDLRTDLNNFYNMLVSLGIDNPYEIDPERINEFANKKIPLMKMHPTVKEIVLYYYSQFKDVEE